MNKLSKKKFISLFVSITIIAFLAFSISILVNYYTSSTNDNIVIAEDLSSQYKYTLKDYNGKVAIFKYNETSPYKILEIYTNNLPEYDKNQLQKGIDIEDEATLNKYIEDFDS